ncbi:MAG: hypothetical protein KGL15_11975 [Acidobacteriota bacterium]|nr:hypothetical protein [Acidobacteriota bacterium]
MTWGAGADGASHGRPQVGSSRHRRLQGPSRGTARAAVARPQPACRHQLPGYRERKDFQTYKIKFDDDVTTLAGATIASRRSQVATWSAPVPLSAGSNTLTATLTSDAGNTTTATATVTYLPLVTARAPPQIAVKSRRFNGRAVLVKLACATGGANCAGKIALRYTHTVLKHHKKHRVTATIASKRCALAAGHTATASVGLNATGRRLLKADRKLPGVKGTVTLSGDHAKTLALTLKQPAKHKK